MKLARFVATAAISSMLSTTVMAGNDGIESNYEIQNTYQHEHSQDKVPEWADQERERRTEKNRFEKHLVDVDGDGSRLKAQNRYRNQERHQMKNVGGDFGRSNSSGNGSAGTSSGSGKGSRGRN
ncbi:MAG: hypothetical protein OEU50_02275 [Gammaproteobacteria bacterium]|nr:hypothetical protein [Gammaproteobacteria bacterium]